MAAAEAGAEEGEDLGDAVASGVAEEALEGDSGTTSSFMLLFMNGRCWVCGGAMGFGFSHEFLYMK